MLLIFKIPNLQKKENSLLLPVSLRHPLSFYPFLLLTLTIMNMQLRRAILNKFKEVELKFIHYEKS